MPEMLDIVDENGVPTGQSVPRTTAHAEGLRHRTSHVWIVRRKNGRVQVLLQMRCAAKDSYPGRLKILDDIQDRLDLLLIYLLSGLEDQIVRYRRKVPAQITVIIDISNDILRYFHLLIR